MFAFLKIVQILLSYNYVNVLTLYDVPIDCDFIIIIVGIRELFDLILYMLEVLLLL